MKGFPTAYSIAIKGKYIRIIIKFKLGPMISFGGSSLAKKPINLSAFIRPVFFGSN